MEENNQTAILGIEKRTKYFIHVLAGLCVISVIVFMLLVLGSKSLGEQEAAAVDLAPDPFQNIELQAKGAVVWDVINHRELFSKNADLPLPLASLTKVMTALTANSKLPGSYNVKIEQQYLEPEGDSNLIAGDVWQADDLRDFTLLTSSNDGAFALAAVSELREGNSANSEEKFIKAMNAKASEIGLSNSRFFNEHGLDRETEKGGAYGSAVDMAKLFEYIMKNEPDILEATRYKDLQFASAERVYNASNTNIFIDSIPNILASKTGYTALAGGNLVIAYDAGLNRPIVIAILGSTQDGRFTDAQKLAEASMKFISGESIQK